MSRFCFKRMANQSMRPRAAIEAALGLQADLVAGPVELAFHLARQLEPRKLGRHLLEHHLHRIRRDLLQSQEQGDGIIRNLP